MTYDIAGKVALVTGGGNGIGRAICFALAAKGAKIAIVDIDTCNGKLTKNQLNSKIAPNTSLFVQCDITDETALKVAFEETVKAFGKLHILVNNAGTVDDTASGWRTMVELNLVALIAACRLAIDNFISDDGVIVNVSSLAANRETTFPIYAATKGAVTTFSRSLGGPRSYNATKVRVMAIEPGLTRTNLSDIAYLSTKVWLRTDTPTDSLEKRIRSGHSSQTSEKVADCVVDALLNGKSGSVWTVIGGQWTVNDSD